MRRFFEKEITNLSKCEIFVFGSNLQGQHHGGAARLAHEKFGAEWGIGVGPTGQCYAIPTMQGKLDDIKPYVDDFIEYARTHPNNRFLVTRVGCGIAGFTDEEMAPLFKTARKLPNVNFSKEWLLEIYSDEFIDAYCFDIVPKEEIIPIPEALTEEDIIKLCKEYKYIIGSGVKAPLPKLRIRYVIDRDRFGYANFGDFFMLDDGRLYVWSRDEKFKESHNQAIVEEIFGDECSERKKYFNKTIFAGVETKFVDFHGRKLYTGDVIRVWLKGNNDSPKKKYYKKDSMLLALGTFGVNGNSWIASYACVLDNHCVFPDMCARIEWCGTVFYQLDWEESPITVAQRCMYFQDVYCKNGFNNEDREVLAKYTPNFDKELWKYHANKILGIE